MPSLAMTNVAGIGKDPCVVTLMIGKLPAAGFENLLRLVADPDGEIERKGIAIVHVG